MKILVYPQVVVGPIGGLSSINSHLSWNNFFSVDIFFPNLA